MQNPSGKQPPTQADVIGIFVFGVMLGAGSIGCSAGSIKLKNQRGIAMETVIIAIVILGILWLVKSVYDYIPVLAGITLVAIGVIGIYFIVRLIIKLIWKIAPNIYFKSKKFLAIKEQIKDYINDCNELNAHIEELKSIPLLQKAVDYGMADLVDSSLYNYARPESENTKYENNIYNCSLTVCKNAQQQPFKYLCKYFNIKPTEQNLSYFENLLNNFEAAEQGKVLLKNEQDKIILSISQDVPKWVRKKFSARLSSELGFKPIDLSDLYFPKYTFQYVSAGGNSSLHCDIIMNIDNLNKFVVYLSDLIKFKNSAAGQRALMTSALREKIKERDNYTCQICGLSTYQEPNLLLEIDHITPISRNGLTIESNLQTLCWRCNRGKGNKLL